MKKIIVYITLAILVAACAPSSRHSGEVTGVGGTAWNEPNTLRYGSHFSWIL